MKLFEYSYADIASASGKTENSVRVDISRGKVNPEDLGSLAVYIAMEKLKGLSCVGKE